MAAPNILWICSDQQRWDTIGALGNPHVRTPHLDRLCQAGTAFTHAFCQSPICTPSRSSFLTGLYPSTVHGCRNGNDRWAEAAELLPKTLRERAGYDCGLAGKLHLAGAHRRPEPRPADDGYRVFHWSHSPRDEWGRDHAYRRWVEAQGQNLAALLDADEPVPAAYHQTTFCADQAIAFMAEERAGPWLMSVNLFDPHAPFDPPTAYRQRYDAAALPGPYFRASDLEAQAQLRDIEFQTRAQRPEACRAHELQAAYYAMIELIDDNVGRMLRALEDTGQRANTLVVFTSDHGEMLGDHGLVLKGCRFYEGLVRVPLIWSWPERIRAGVVSDALVELTDIAPTLLDFAHADAPSRSSLWRGNVTLPVFSRIAPSRNSSASWWVWPATIMSTGAGNMRRSSAIGRCSPSRLCVMPMRQPSMVSIWISLVRLSSEYGSLLPVAQITGANCSSQSRTRV